MQGQEHSVSHALIATGVVTGCSHGSRLQAAAGSSGREVLCCPHCYGPCMTHVIYMQVLWGNWGSCSASCGPSTHTWTATITQQPTNGGASCPDLPQTGACNTPPCPPDCQVSWGSWGACNSYCGGGSQSLVATVAKQPANGGAPCLALTQTRACNTWSCAWGRDPSPPSPPEGGETG